MILRSDIKHGLKRVVLRHVLVFAVALFAGYLTYAAVFTTAGYIAIDYKSTMGDMVLCLFGGIPVYSPSSGKEFEFPMVWIAIFVAAAYVTLDYPLHDLQGVGATSIVISGSRWSWWLSKCSWVIINACIICVLWAITILIFTLISGSSFGLTPTSEGVMLSGLRSIDNQPHPLSLGMYVLSLLPLLISILLIQLFVSLMAGPYVALAATLAILFLSTFYMSPYLLGEYLLAGRNAAILTNGVDSGIGILFALGVSTISILIGGMIFTHKDILAGKANGND